jgi:hypothetical protein
LENFAIRIIGRLNEQIHFGVARNFQLPLGCELRLLVNRAAGAPEQINVPALAKIICTRPKQQHLALRINGPQYTGDGLMFSGRESHGQFVAGLFGADMAFYNTCHTNWIATSLRSSQ